MKLQEKLIEYGLSEKESTVYLTLLKLGSATTTQIADSSKISRTTIYDIIKSLRDKRIVSSMKKNKVLHIEAAPPEKLIRILETKRDAIKQILPELKTIEQGVPHLPRTELFVGKEGVKTVYRTLIDKRKPLVAYSNTKAMLQLLPYYAPRYMADRVKKNIPLKLFSEKSDIAKEILFSKDAKEKRETKTFDELKKAAVTIYISDEIVALLSTSKEEPLGVLIHHKEFAKAQQIIFKKLWDLTKKEKTPTNKK